MFDYARDTMGGKLFTFAMFPAQMFSTLVCRLASTKKNMIDSSSFLERRVPARITKQVFKTLEVKS